MMDGERKSTDAYTYHSIACLQINFRAEKTVQNTPPIVETEVLYHPLDGLLIPITNYVAQERLTEDYRTQERMRMRIRRSKRSRRVVKKKRNSCVSIKDIHVHISRPGKKNEKHIIFLKRLNYFYSFR